MVKRFYITTTLPYVNAEPHIGFALEIVAADVLARFHRLQGEETIFNTGTDEHGQKIYKKALEANQDPQAYCDVYAAKFGELKELLDLSYTHFIRTTNPHHMAAAQEFWRRCKKNGYIYKKLYKIKYCVGCELEKTDSELINGRCPLHPNLELEIREEENYFFKFSAFQELLPTLYEKNSQFVVPAGKFSEIKAFVARGLQDFSISRLKVKMPWGVPVPEDSEQVMYVWFDALVNYISTLGWPEDEITFKAFWPGIQIAGKDNLRQQSAMWQAMLLAADLPASARILINGFISVDGQKMSKSLGNVIAPKDMVARFGTDGTRYLLINLGPIGEDMDVSIAKFNNTYTADLTNGLGNLFSRIAALCAKSDSSFKLHGPISCSDVISALKNYDLRGGLSALMSEIKDLDKEISAQKPWEMSPEKLHDFLTPIVSQLRQIAVDLEPFLPQTSEKLKQHFFKETIGKLAPLFPRLSE